MRGAVGRMGSARAVAAAPAAVAFRRPWLWRAVRSQRSNMGVRMSIPPLRASALSHPSRAPTAPHRATSAGIDNEDDVISAARHCFRLAAGRGGGRVAASQSRVILSSSP